MDDNPFALQESVKYQ